MLRFDKVVSWVHGFLLYYSLYLSACLKYFIIKYIFLNHPSTRTFLRPAENEDKDFRNSQVTVEKVGREPLSWVDEIAGLLLAEWSGDWVPKRCMYAQLCPTVCDPWTVTCQAPLSTGFPRQEYWNGLPFPSWGDRLNPGIEPTSPVSPALAGRFFIAEPPGKPYKGFADMLSPFPFIALILCEISLSASQQMMLQERKRLLLQETKRK